MSMKMSDSSRFLAMHQDWRLIGRKRAFTGSISMHIAWDGLQCISCNGHRRGPFQITRYPV